MVMLLMMEISLSFSFPIALCDADDAASFKYMYKAAEAYILQEFSMTCILLCCTSLTAAACNSSSSGSSVQHSTFRILAMTTENNDMGGVTMFTEMAALTQFAYNFLTTVNVHQPRQNS